MALGASGAQNQQDSAPVAIFMTSLAQGDLPLTEAQGSSQNFRAFWDDFCLVAQVVKNTPTNAGDRHRFDPWVRKIPWRRKWQPTLVFSPGEPQGQRSLAGYNPWCRTESDTTEVSQHMHMLLPLNQAWKTPLLLPNSWTAGSGGSGKNCFQGTGLETPLLS
ncbi:unnamed protein product [Rangifer tarandus platyrhynchus]|uniref:Uncharacterized protein n=2 Tax=Rangifer tarandus platyrhynchus TaxID=3082113 RepID=A0AC59Y3N5_RANTA|nr:unnamed protein product [Rangifer tarandus platyrhynchus]